LVRRPGFRIRTLFIFGDERLELSAWRQLTGLTINQLTFVFLPWIHG